MHHTVYMIRSEIGDGGERNSGKQTKIHDTWRFIFQKKSISGGRKCFHRSVESAENSQAERRYFSFFFKNALVWTNLAVQMKFGA